MASKLQTFYGAGLRTACRKYIWQGTVFRSSFPTFTAASFTEGSSSDTGSGGGPKRKGLPSREQAKENFKSLQSVPECLYQLPDVSLVVVYYVGGGDDAVIADDHDHDDVVDNDDDDVRDEDDVIFVAELTFEFPRDLFFSITPHHLIFNQSFASSCSG